MADTSRKVTFTGLDELRAALVSMPRALTIEAGRDVEAAANGAAATIQAFYGSHKVTGALRDSVRVNHTDRGGLRATSVVRINSPLAWLFDHGTQARHYMTHNGVKHLTGRMPPTHIVARTAARARRALQDKHRAMLERHGATVTVDAG